MAGVQRHRTSQTCTARPPRRPVWRLVDALVPHTQATRRVRTCALVALTAITASAVAETVRGPLDGDRVAALRDAPATTAPPAPLAPGTGVPLTPGGGPAPVIARIETTDPVVFLTIDDGHTRTPESAAALAELGAPATLFLVDAPIRRGAAFFRALPGTVVENHSRRHPDMRTLPEPRQVEEICGNADTVAAAFGRRPVLFRPPYGNYDEATRRAAAACGMAAIVLWDVTVEGGTLRFRQHPRLRPGDIVLLHFSPELPGDLRTVARAVRRAGLRFALLEDYLLPPAPAAGGGA